MDKVQKALDAHMRKLGLPREFSHIIARRCQSWDEHSVESGLPDDADEILLGGFAWIDTPEGHAFWSGMHEAIRDERFSKQAKQRRRILRETD